MTEGKSVVVQLGLTPRYLDPRCHEALYEVDLGVYEVRDRLDGDLAGREGTGHHKSPPNGARRSSQARDIVHGKPTLFMTIRRLWAL